MPVKLLQLCPTLCDTMDSSLPGSSVHGVLQERVLELVAIPSSRGSSQPKEWTCVSCIAGRFFTTGPLGKPILALLVKAKYQIKICYLNVYCLEKTSSYVLSYGYIVPVGRRRILCTPRTCGKINFVMIFQPNSWLITDFYIHKPSYKYLCFGILIYYNDLHFKR